MVVSTGPMLNASSSGRDWNPAPTLEIHSEAVAPAHDFARANSCARTGMSRTPVTCMTMGIAVPHGLLLDGSPSLALPFNANHPLPRAVDIETTVGMRTNRPV